MADVAKSVAILFTGTDSGASATADKLSASLNSVGVAASKAASQSSEVDQKWANSAIRAQQLATAANEAAIATAKQGDAAAVAGAKSEGAAVGVSTMANAFRALAGSIVVKEFIDANVAVENFGKAMTVITGSSTDAATALSYVKTISNTLGLDVASAASAFVQLTAASKGTALEGQATRDIFEAISKAMALLGKSSADTQGALTAVQQIISKGTVSAEELRGQLGERLPGAFQIAARSVGLTTSELGKMLESGQLLATDFLPKFAAELNRTFGDTTFVSSYTAEVNRLQNAFRDLATSDIGTALFTSITQALIDVSSVTASTAKELKFLDLAGQAIVNVFRRDSFSGFIDDMRTAGIVAAGTGKSFNDPLNESLAETSRLARFASDATASLAAEYEAETAKFVRQAGAQADAAKEVNEILAKLGIDPKKLKDPLLDLQEEFSKLVRTGDASAAALGAAFDKALSGSKTIEDINLMGGALTASFASGQISVEQFGKEVAALALQQDKVSKATGVATDSIAKQQAAADKAKDATAKMALELEKLASNERIKTMEFKVQLDIARIQADAQKVIAAFDSINNTINSTADVIGSIFDAFKGINSLDSSARNALFKQLDIENDLRREAFELQKELTKELTRAQIESMNAQTRSLNSGNALIKIDGAGLQPHLEAFMWEILRTIQVRVNQDGLKLLLGV